MKIVIPSYKRSDKQKTLRYLKGKVNPQDIFLVVDEEEKDLYNRYKEECNIITTNAKGIANVRNFITQYFHQNEVLLCMDDDITMMYKCEGKIEGKFVKSRIDSADKFKQFTRKHLDKMIENKVSLMGLYPVDNAMFMTNQKQDFNKGNCYVLGVCYFVVNKKTKLLDNELWCKEEMERSVLHYPSMRSNKYCYSTSYYAKGGINATGRTDDIERICAEKLVKKYPKHFIKTYLRKNGKTDVRWRKKLLNN